MLYAIYAYESMYGGLHGMNSFLVVECESMEEAEEIGSQESLNVMESYNDIMSSIYEEASQEYEEETDEWYGMVDSIMEENSAYEIFEIKNTKVEGRTMTDLENEFFNDKDSFIKKYC